MNKLPDTSISANKQAAELKEVHKAKIMEALAALGEANFEAIAIKAKLEKHQVGRRLIDLEREQKIYKPGGKSLTESGRMSYNYRVAVIIEERKAFSIIQGEIKFDFGLDNR